MGGFKACTDVAQCPEERWALVKTEMNFHLP